jgi:hypothetical protein
MSVCFLEEPKVFVARRCQRKFGGVHEMHPVRVENADLLPLVQLSTDPFFLQEMPRRFNVPWMHGGESVLTWKPGRRSRG